MQAAGCSGTLLARLAPHVSAACSGSAAGFSGHRRVAITAASLATGQGQGLEDAAAAAAATARLPPLTPEQRRQLPLLTSLLRRPGDQAQRLGALTALSASFRDLAVATTALQMRQHDLEPRADNHTDLAHQLKLQETTATRDNEPAAAATAAAGTSAATAPPLPRRGTFLPLKDVTMLPEDVAVDGRSEAPAAPRYDVSYMDKISCWAAMQPSHIEVSQPLMTGIQLFPPLEAAYPTYVDFDAATRLLSHRTSRKRLRLQRRLLRKQDKYQIKTWDHYAGSA